MKIILFIAMVIPFSINLKAKIIYTDPVRNAKYVNIENNIIIGFDEEIKKPVQNSYIVVKGSSSGIHSGEIIITSDRKKLIFKPHQPFALNESVEVFINSRQISPSSENKLVYSFQTQKSRPESNSINSFVNEFQNSSFSYFSNSSDSLYFPTLTVNISNNPSPGNLMLGNFPYGPIPYTPYLIIADNSGNFIHSSIADDWVLDYKRQPNGLLTYGTEGTNNEGAFYAKDHQHNVVDSFKCGNGHSTDLHELRILNNGHALLMSYEPVHIDMRPIVAGGHRNALVRGLLIQELDVNKNVVFQWRSFDHIPITDAQHQNLTSDFIDYVHGNAIELDNDGNILISSRHLCEITKINRSTGEIIWRLGGAQNEFTFVNDSIGFHYQHHIRRLPNGNITLYDNGNFHTPAFSRAVEYHLDEVNKVATLVWQYRNTPDIFGFAMGSVQRLRNGNTLIGWGATNPSFTEVTPEGNVVLEMTLPTGMFSYRIFRDEQYLTLNVKLVVEGHYDYETDKLNISDTVTAYLRNLNSPFEIVDSSRSIIDSVNFNGNFRFYNAPAGTYYIAVKHRNSIETWSKSGGETFALGGNYEYDFTNSNSQAYGGNLVLKGNKYCIYSGDVNQDGIIETTDLIYITEDVSRFRERYLNSDIDGNGVTELNDIVIAYNNGIKFISAMTP